MPNSILCLRLASRPTLCQLLPEQPVVYGQSLASWAVLGLNELVIRYLTQPWSGSLEPSATCSYFFSSDCSGGSGSDHMLLKQELRWSKLGSLGMYILRYFFTGVSPSGENEDVPGGMDFAKLLTVTVQGNGRYSWSASPLLRSLCLSSRKGSAVVTESSLL